MVPAIWLGVALDVVASTPKKESRGTNPQSRWLPMSRADYADTETTLKSKNRFASEFHTP